MKKSCAGCRALSGEMANSSCALGYKINDKSQYIEGVGKIWFPVPAEQCPKPTAWKKFFNTDHKRLQGNNGGK